MSFSIRRALVPWLAVIIVLVGPTSAAQAAPAEAGGCDQTLQSLVDAASPGATLRVPPCVYRETVKVSKPLVLIGQPGTEIRGSDVWTNWTPSPSGWVSQPTVPTLSAASADPNACEVDSNSCFDPEQVFYDGVQLTRAPAGSAPQSGQFTDDGTHIILADNPSGHLVEVSTRPRWVVTGADGITIQGFTMRQAANGALTGAVSNDGFSNWTLQDSVLRDAHAADVSLHGGANVRILGSDIGNAGLAGISASGVSTGGLIQANHVHDNRTPNAGFRRSWGAGGIKLTHVENVVVDGNEVDHNDGTGLWCDIDCTNVSFSSNRIHHNQWMGINFEISNGASIHDNALWENGWGFQSWGWGAGITVSSSANAEIFNNTVAWNYAGISVIWQDRPDSPGPTPVGNYVHDNVIVKRTISGDFSDTYWSNLSLAWLSDGTAPLYSPEYNNRGAGNAIWYDAPEGQSVRFTWTSQYFNLSRFSDTPGGSGTYYLNDLEVPDKLSSASVPVQPEGAAEASANL
jgi:hypothetical protein